ncbi:MAG: hypothetical protein E5V88_13125 [Mesorhizobium sp.]|nr:MAG: hypothetical protein E5V88_13125 [Mesorhizobium sp.]
MKTLWLQHEVITAVQRRRRWTTAERVRLVGEAMQPSMSVSYVARRAGIAPAQLLCLEATYARRRRNRGSG